MKTWDRVCPNCGYDFPLNEEVFREELRRVQEQNGFAFSSHADTILNIAAFIFGCAAFLCAFSGVAALLFGKAPAEKMAGLLVSVLACTTNLALSILCTRAVNWKNKP